MKDYERTRLRSPVSVESIVSVHYFEYPIDFSYGGEVHDFWEIVYSDKGDAIITAGSRDIDLPREHLYLHKPMEYHNIRCGKSGAVNAFIVSFDADCPELFAAAGKVIACDATMRELMAKIIVETQNAFSSPIDVVKTSQLDRREKPLFGSEQMIRLYLEQLLIRLIRREYTDTALPPTSYPLYRRKGDALVQAVCRYLESHVADGVSVEDLCREFSVSKSTLQKLFQGRVGCGISQYCQQLRVDRAKTLIREKSYNFTEIAQQLGYSSVHYFSRNFRQVVGMSPSEYAVSVKALTQVPEETDTKKEKAGKPSIR